VDVIGTSRIDLNTNGAGRSTIPSVSETPAASKAQAAQSATSPANASKTSPTSTTNNAAASSSYKRSSKKADQSLGNLSKKYETSGRGPGTVSTGKGDPGGVSYGSYQLASKTGTLKKFLANEGSPWANNFAGLDPTLPNGEFAKNWKEIALRSPNEFEQAQHAFIQRTHYQPVIDDVKKKTGLDISGRSPALKDAVWSTAVQHGAAKSIIGTAVESVKVSADSPSYDEALINAIYDQRTKYVGGLPKPDNLMKKSIYKRYASERKDALAMMKGD
jgi:hypothetical protein